MPLPPLAVIRPAVMAVPLVVPAITVTLPLLPVPEPDVLMVEFVRFIAPPVLPLANAAITTLPPLLPDVVDWDEIVRPGLALKSTLPPVGEVGLKVTAAPAAVG